MDPSFRPWQTAFKWLTYGRREFAAATCDMGISAYKYKTRLILAIQRIQHSDVVQFYAVFCKIDRISDLSVVGLLRFLYLSLQICSHECDNRTNEVFLCLNAEDSGEKIWSTFLLRPPLHLSMSRLYWMSVVEQGLVEKSPHLSTLEGASLPFRHSWNRNVFLCSLFGIVCSPVEDTSSLLYLSVYFYLFVFEFVLSYVEVTISPFSPVEGNLPPFGSSRNSNVPLFLFSCHNVPPFRTVKIIWFLGIYKISLMQKKAIYVIK